VRQREQEAVIFVPATAPEAKIAQLLVYAQPFSWSMEPTIRRLTCAFRPQEYGWYKSKHRHEPYTTEGKKTAALEIAEQLGWNVPHALIVGWETVVLSAQCTRGFRTCLRSAGSTGCRA